jgi:hypothetical protein
MAQTKTFGWNNNGFNYPKNLNTGFDVSSVRIVDITAGNSWYWNDKMPDTWAYEDTTAVVLFNDGVSRIPKISLFGSPITAFTNANPGVITCEYIEECGILVGDTVKVTGVADDMTGAMLNGQYIVAAVTPADITLTSSTIGLSAYVSGGYVSRVKDSYGKDISTKNFSVCGVRLGILVIGTAASDVVAEVHGKNCVV